MTLVRTFVDFKFVLFEIRNITEDKKILSLKILRRK